jgi:MerR family transcriptional regulator/heat shock protein HspR
MAERRSFLKLVRVLSDLDADAEFVESLVQAEIVYVEHDQQGEALISAEDAERVRLVKLLIRELDVNLAGVEVILHMRESMLAMHKQVEEILDAVAEELRGRKP